MRFIIPKKVYNHLDSSYNLILNQYDRSNRDDESIILFKKVYKRPLVSELFLNKVSASVSS